MIGKKVTEALTVSPQIQVDDIEAIKSAGFRSILCNRPDNEESGQPAFAAVEAAAKAVGIEIRHQPVGRSDRHESLQCMSTLEPQADRRNDPEQAVAADNAFEQRLVLSSRAADQIAVGVNDLE